MSTIRSFIKREPVLLAAALAALLSCLLVPPDGGYLSYFDFRTLSLLYCLMAVVSGLRTAGLFAHLAHVFCRKAASVRAMGLVLTLLCFFSAMLITNDVALLTFVPFAVVVLGMADRRTDLIHIVVLQTAAANLGSMLTPRVRLQFWEFLLIVPNHKLISSSVSAQKGSSCFTLTFL